MPRVTSKDGTRIAYEKTGQGPGVVLVNGALGHRRHHGEGPLAAGLSRDFTVVFYDRRGRGDSTDTQPYPVRLYGFSSGAVLAVLAAARLGAKVAKLAVLEPPFNADDEPSRREFLAFAGRLQGLLREGRTSDATAFFLAGMVPPDALEGMKGTPAWEAMVAVAATLAYDTLVLGDGTVPVRAARAITAPALMLDGGESPDFKHRAADDLAAALPNALRRTLRGQTTLVPADVLAPVLREFFLE